MLGWLSQNFTITKSDLPVAIRSVTVGAFMAFSPFLGIQIPLIFLIGWLFGLRTAIMLAVSYAINNPFITTVPIMVAEYAFGYVIINKMLGIDMTIYNPSWLVTTSRYIAQKIGSRFGVITFSIWYYIIGSLLVACIAGIIAYYIAKRKLKKLVTS